MSNYSFTYGPEDVWDPRLSEDAGTMPGGGRGMKMFRVIRDYLCSPRPPREEGEIELLPGRR